MIEQFNEAQCLSLNKYPRISSKILQYGTAGFREKSSELSHVLYRMGLLAVLRSKAKNGCTVGLMITASHNPEEDNGVKLCDPDSKMLDKEWEIIATKLINTDDKSLQEELKSIVQSNNINYNFPAHVYLAKDTRKSSTFLLEAAVDGVNCLKGEAKVFGLLTTPQLHFAVYCKNFSSYGVPTEDGYYEKLSKCFEILRSNAESKKRYSSEVHVDGANGVGALKFKELQKNLKSLKVKIFNDGSSGILNYKCGADFVKIEQKPPEGCEMVSLKSYASFDGDADRLVYFYRDESGIFHLLDGDKIATLMAKFLKKLIDATSLKLKMRVVQTAYANGSSTNYIENVLKIPVICVPTGVKYLHHEALKYDIGIYFEANGHGTVVFSTEAKQSMQNLASGEGNESQPQINAAKKFLSVIDLINETVGDAISDLLFVEVILHELDWNIVDWNKLYKDLPNRQLKVKVPDRNAITTTDAERKCVKPEGLQEAVDAIVLNFKLARSFVRPSGTEDVVRVYSEADTQEQADKLAEEVKKLVEQFTKSS